MTRPIHGAYVEEYVDDEGDLYFVATCAETLIQCDAFAFPDIELAGWDGRGEQNAIARALTYLGNRELHDKPGDEHFCDADHVHVVEMQRSPTIELTLIARLTRAGLVTVDPPEKKVAHLLWASPHYIAMCLWRLYGRTLAEREARK